MSDDRLVPTLVVRRDLDLGGGRRREYGQLAPEAHTWFAMEHYLHSGELEECTVTVDDFRAAVERYCPELADEIYEAVGLGASTVESNGTPRAANMVPQSMPALYNPDVAAELVPVRGPDADLPTRPYDVDHVTVVATEVGQNSPTPEAPLPPDLEASMGTTHTGDGTPAEDRVYEDATTLDPKTENELLHGSDEESIKRDEQRMKEVLDSDGAPKAAPVGTQATEEQLKNGGSADLVSHEPSDAEQALAEQNAMPGQPAKKQAASQSAKKAPVKKAAAKKQPAKKAAAKSATKSAAKKAPAKKST